MVLQAGTAVMNSPQNPATSVVCFCDPVAPQFSYSAAARNNYWPEALFASNQGLDTDQTGQTYMDSNGNPSLACPFPARGCSFDGARLIKTNLERANLFGCAAARNKGAAVCTQPQEHPARSARGDGPRCCRRDWHSFHPRPPASGD